MSLKEEYNFYHFLFWHQPQSDFFNAQVKIYCQTFFANLVFCRNSHRFITKRFSRTEESKLFCEHWNVL